MKKLTNWFKWLDNNILKYYLYVFIFFIPLWFKFPLIDIEFTYISIRLDDVFIALLYLLFIIQVLRKKVKPRYKFLIPIILFWIAVFTSFFLAHYVFKTVPIYMIGIFHTLRRIEYMFVFFVAMASVDSKATFIQYIRLYVIAMLIVSIYGVGQRFFNLPAVQTMNPEYARGRVLYLTPEARISSTFGGHYDLSSYLVLSLPLAFAYYLYTNRKRFILYTILAISNLVFTVQRISFIAYVATITPFLLIARKFKLYLLIALITVGLIFTSGDLIKRFAQTFQFKLIFVNRETGDVTISQKITTKELPAGNYEIPIPQKISKKVNPDKKTQEELLELARKKALEEQMKKGGLFSDPANLKRVNEIAALMDIKKVLLCDISCSTRIQIEWPRAIVAFVVSPFFGSGPSSLTEATDNDYLRWLGEFGLVGTLLFLYILFGIMRFLYKHSKTLPKEEKFLYYGFLFGFIALLMNATYLDVFEASKVAYNFWFLSGIFVGYLLLISKSTKQKA